MIQRFQKALDAFIENFQTRWETQPGFRSTWSIVGSATALIILCSCALLGSNVLSGYFSGPSSPGQAKVIIINNNNAGTTFPISTDQPAATQIPLTGGTPVPTVPFAPTATPKATPFGTTPTPSATATPQPGATDTPTPSSNLTVTASPAGPWVAGQQASISPITTAPPQPNAQMQIDFQFGSSPNCTLNGQTVQLDDNGAATSPTQLSQPIPSCVHGMSVPITATFSVNGLTYTNSSFGTASGP